ncbi:MAG TPA: dipeptidase [Bacteroidia bacterium]|nr:dipeptidase [Bacteroidia bacterium]HNT80698.1 dipeptidase [Bacteroidia bacterium]
MDYIQNYIKENRERFLNELFDFLRIPSVSADSKYKEDVVRAAEFVKKSLLDAGADSAEVCKTEGHPIVYGEKMIDANKPTVLVYGHYDVQPPDPLDLWKSPPFEPVIENDKIYARGACDDKGQVYMHIKAFELMQKTNTLSCNVKFMIEGEEEVGSANLAKFIEKHKEKLKSDIILISDTAMIANDIPSIDSGLRGLSYVEVEVTGPNRDLHSGVYGGAVANPIQILCKMITDCKDKNNHITIPGFYDDVLELSDAERKDLARAPFDLNEYKKDLGIEDIMGEAGFSTMERTGIRPSFELNGIWGGYTGEGSKTVLPSKAFAKISMRLVPNQDSHKITDLFKNYFENAAPKGIKVKVTPHHGGEPVVTPTDSIAYMAASKAMETTFGKTPIPTRGGGSIPIVALFERVLGLKSVLFGFGLDSDAIHSPNEHFGVFNYLKGIETIPLFFKNYTEMSSKK